jgi:polysaccharide biosynthesis protein PslG
MPPRGVVVAHGKRLAIALAMLVALLATAQLAGAEGADARRALKADRSAARAAFRLVPPNPYAGRVGYAGSLVWYRGADQLDWLNRARATGASWVREDFHWGAFEPTPGQWNWSAGDRLMRNASLSGMEVLGMVGYSAEWAASGPTIYHPPADPDAYAAFCRRLVERYGPGGTFWQANPGLSPRPLQALEIWNEPWHASFWRPQPNPSGYAALVRAAAAAIHAANPTVKVLASADVFQMRTDTPESLDWFRLLLQADPTLFRTQVDAYSVHLYSQERGPYDTVAQQRWRYDRSLITRDLAAAAGATHPLWITEFGWTTSPSHPDAVSEATQATFVRQAIQRAVGEWGGFVERTFMYRWGRAENDHAGGYGAFRKDGSAKPLFGALELLLNGG